LGNIGHLRQEIGINSGIKPSDANFSAILLGFFGWGGRIRIHILEFQASPIEGVTSRLPI
jgi:hypothetical protein